MKRKARKLALHRDTLRTLQLVQVRRAAGGGDTHEIQTGCACSDGCCPPSVGCPTRVGCNTDGCPGNTDEILSGCATNC
jgi:hypothetical protein